VSSVLSGSVHISSRSTRRTTPDLFRGFGADLYIFNTAPERSLLHSSYYYLRYITDDKATSGVYMYLRGEA
jgi:hypothetical protein